MNNKLNILNYTKHTLEELNCTGVYKIKILGSNKTYIGSTTNISGSSSKSIGFLFRWRCHLSDLLKNKHHTPKLQNAFNKYKNVEFSIVEIINNAEITRQREQYYLDNLLFAQEYIKKENNLFTKLAFNSNPVSTQRSYNKGIPNYKLAKKIKQYSLDGTFISNHQSMREANRKTNISFKAIHSVLKGKRVSAGGFIWRYEDDSFDKYSTINKKIKTKIEQYDKNKTLLKTYNSITEIQKDFKCIGNIYRSLKDFNRMTYGYYWKRVII